MKNKYTSLELSKKLKEAGCELESDMIIKEAHCKKDEKGYIHIAHSCPRSVYLENDKFDTYYKDLKEIKIYKTYDILRDICVKYAKEFFGKKDILSNYEVVYDGDYESVEKDYEEAYIVHTHKILRMLQQDKPQDEVEEYIWENTVFNNKNKEKR